MEYKQLETAGLFGNIRVREFKRLLRQFVDENKISRATFLEFIAKEHKKEDTSEDFVENLLDFKETSNPDTFVSAWPKPANRPGVLFLPEVEKVDVKPIIVDATDLIGVDNTTNIVICTSSLKDAYALPIHWDTAVPEGNPRVRGSLVQRQKDIGEKLELNRDTMRLICPYEFKTKGYITHQFQYPRTGEPQLRRDGYGVFPLKDGATPVDCQLFIDAPDKFSTFRTFVTFAYSYYVPDETNSSAEVCTRKIYHALTPEALYAPKDYSFYKPERGVFRYFAIIFVNEEKDCGKLFMRVKRVGDYKEYYVQSQTAIIAEKVGKHVYEVAIVRKNEEGEYEEVKVFENIDVQKNNDIMYAVYASFISTMNEHEINYYRI